MTAPELKSEPWDIGTGVHGYAWRARRPRAALLLQHGFGEYAERYVDRYNRLVPALLEHGVDVYAFDARGHGRSPGPRGVVDVRAAVADHQAARSALAKPDHPLFLFGHSLGGLITAASVAERADDVAGVILSAPALLLRTNPVLSLLAPLLARLTPGLGVQPPLGSSGISRLDEEVRAYAADPMIHHGKLPALTGASALAAARAAWPRYPKWRAPTLVVHGTADTFTDPTGSRRLVDTIASTDKRLIMVEGGRHELLNDLDRDETRAAILSWLDDRLPPA